MKKAPHSNVRAEMARMGVTQVQLAAHLDMAQAAVSRRLTGATPWRIDELQAVAAFLGVPVTTLLPTEARTPSPAADAGMAMSGEALPDTG